MARRAFIAGQTKRITHPDDKENPTVYVIQAVPERVKSYIRDKAFQSEDGGIEFSAGRSALLTLQAGLLNVENLLGADDKPVDCGTEIWDLGGGAKHTCISDKGIDLLPTTDTQWLVTQINDFANLTETQAGNSAGQ